MSTFWDHDPQTGEIHGGTKPNITEYSVTEISHALKRTLEDAFGHVRVRGEISGFRGPHSSGHCYFCIKDEGAKLEAVVWRSSFARVKDNLREGLEVVATGKITGYPNKSAYQIVIESLEPAGAGALMVLLEERKKKLAAEGFFDSARKKPLPFLPKLIGIVTSPTGAVIRDILHRLQDRFPRHVILWPVRVQGETSAAEVAAAIAGLNKMTPRPDLIIVARGGGSLEDLWGFNDEIVVRAVVASAIPLISAVGHETDTTLIDHAADWRAPTPTAAAERAVPVRIELLAQLASHAARHERCWRRGMEERETRVRAAARALPKPEDILALARQRHDTAAGRLTQALRSNTHQHRSRFERLSGRLSLRPMQIHMGRERERLERLGRTVGRAMGELLEKRKQALSTQAKLMASLSYRSVLQRGFALVRDAQGLPVRSAAAVKPAQQLAVEFADGSIKVREHSGSKQGSLF